MDPITSKEDAKYYLGRFYFRRKKYRKALKIFQEGLVINPRSFIILYEIGLTYLRMKNYKTVRGYWKKVLEIAPHSILAAEVCWDIRELEQGIQSN